MSLARDLHRAGSFASLGGAILRGPAALVRFLVVRVIWRTAMRPLRKVLP